MIMWHKMWSVTLFSLGAKMTGDQIMAPVNMIRYFIQMRQILCVIQFIA